MNASAENLSPGEKLLKARKESGLNLDTLAERTKIPVASLRAIERDEYHKISGDLYVKSFLRSYAKEVGLEADELIDLYLGFTGETPVGQDGAEGGGWDEQDVQIRRVGLPWGRIGLGVLLLMVIAAALWFFMGRGGEESQAEVSGEEPSALNVIPYTEDEAEAQPTSSSAGSVADTLALGWQLGADEPDPIPEDTIPVEAPAAEAVVSGGHGPAPAGLPGLAFQDGRHWPFVVRLLTDSPGDFAVMRDAEPDFRPAAFAASADDHEPLPGAGVEMGQAYAVAEGLAIYWGMQDHMSLRLGKVQGVRVEINGIHQDTSRFRAGQTILLDASLLQSEGGE